MGEVGIHFTYIGIVVFHGPPEPFDVSGPESEFTTSFHQVKPLRVCVLKGLNDSGCAIGRVVVNDQQVALKGKVKNSTNDLFHVLLLVISRYYYQFVAHSASIGGTNLG